MPNRGQRNGEPPEIDSSVPHAARVYDYLLGGVTNFEADREAAEKQAAAFGGLDKARASVRGNRIFLGQVVRYLADEAGIRQFLDIGTGIPTESNVHEVAQQVAPDSDIVYVDNDPIVLAHAHLLLDSADEGATAAWTYRRREESAVALPQASQLDLVVRADSGRRHQRWSDRGRRTGGRPWEVEHRRRRCVGHPGLRRHGPNRGALSGVCPAPRGSTRCRMSAAASPSRTSGSRASLGGRLLRRMSRLFVRSLGVMEGTTMPRLDVGALVTIDVQRETLDGQVLEIPGTSTAVPRIARLAAAFRAAGRPIVQMVQLYRADGSNAEPLRREVVSGPTSVLRRGTPGQALALVRLGLLWYAAAVVAVCAGFVHLYEEPRLCARFGPEYEDYCRAVRRWRPRRGLDG